MATTRRILKHARVEIAAGTRKCHHMPKKHRIRSGEACLVILDDGGLGKKNYCPSCTIDILDQAERDLAQLRDGFAASSPAVPAVS
ncbi:MAG: hypothetical protein OXG37_04455 [Actinomycetia bacterium]|nr:hypothetical protein [Actinomycetes bacterium]